VSDIGNNELTLDPNGFVRSQVDVGASAVGCDLPTASGQSFLTPDSNIGSTVEFPVYTEIVFLQAMSE